MRLGWVIVAIATIVAGEGLAQELTVAQQEQCGRPEIQASCVATCARGCTDRGFLKANSSFCWGGNYDQTVPPDLADAADCPFNPPPQQAVVAPDVEDCSQIKSITERVACEERGRKPTCASNTPELLDRARELVGSVERELDQYGQLLKLDFSTIDNRDKLCVYSTTDLDGYYDTATKNPDILNALQSQANGIQRCQAEFEIYIAPIPQGKDSAPRGNTGSDALPEAIVASVRRDLNILKPTMENLTKSVATLEDAANRIYQIARLHNTACRPEGTPIAGGQGG